MDFLLFKLVLEKHFPDDVPIARRLTKPHWQKKPRANYHPNYLSTRSVVESFYFLIICVGVSPCVCRLANI